MTKKRKSKMSLNDAILLDATRGNKGVRMNSAMEHSLRHKGKAQKMVAKKKDIDKIYQVTWERRVLNSRKTVVEYIVFSAKSDRGAKEYAKLLTAEKNISSTDAYNSKGAWRVVSIAKIIGRWFNMKRK